VPRPALSRPRQTRRPGSGEFVARAHLLVTSARPGCAVKGTGRNRTLGAVVGKALEPPPKGMGIIRVLVKLQ